MRHSEILFLRYLDDLGSEIENTFTYRAALTISVDVAVVARGYMDVWERACTSGYLSFKRINVDILMTLDKCDALKSFFW